MHTHFIVYAINEISFVCIKFNFSFLVTKIKIELKCKEIKFYLFCLIKINILIMSPKKTVT